MTGSEGQQMTVPEGEAMTGHEGEDSKKDDDADDKSDKTDDDGFDRHDKEEVERMQEEDEKMNERDDILEENFSQLSAQQSPPSDTADIFSAPPLPFEHRGEGSKRAQAGAGPEQDHLRRADQAQKIMRIIKARSTIEV